MNITLRKSLVTLVLLGCLATSHSILAQEQTKPEQAEKPADEFQQTYDQARKSLVSGKITEALEGFHKAADLKKGQCADCFQIIGQICFQLGQYPDAADAFRQLVALKPSDVDAYYNYLGVALYLQDDKKVLNEAIDAFQKAIELSGDKLPKAHYNRGHALLKAGRTKEGIAEFKRYLEVEPKAENADDVRAIISNPKMAGAKFAPAFAVKGIKGEEISLKNLKGKIVLLDFWASWCGPCRDEMPNVKRLVKKYQNDNFVIVGISLDSDRKAFENYIKQEGMTWQQFFDGKGWGNQIGQLYSVHRIPQTILIDQDGVIRAMGLRGEQLSAKVGELLKQLAEQKNDTSTK